MVDFNNENTITTAPKEIVKIMLLERRKYVIDALEYIYKKKMSGIKADIGLLGSRIISLYFEMNKPLSQFYKEEELVDKLLTAVGSSLK